MAVVRLISGSIADQMALNCRPTMGDMLGAFSDVFCLYKGRESLPIFIRYPVGLANRSDLFSDSPSPILSEATVSLFLHSVLSTCLYLRQQRLSKRP